MKISNQRVGILFMGGFLLAGCLALIYFIFTTKVQPKQVEPEAEEVATEAVTFLTDEQARLKYSALPAGSIISKEELAQCNPDCLFYVEEIPDDVFASMNGVSFHEEGVMQRQDLRYIRLLHMGFDKETHIGELVVNASLADEICHIFHTLYQNEYEIESMRLVDAFGGDDHASMVANNTSAFNYRVVDDTDSLSNHAYGAAIDINPLYNPYVTKKGISPIEGEAYGDRSADFPHKIDENDLCYQLFTDAGYKWGGSWKNVKDYQHFEKTTGLSVSKTASKVEDETSETTAFVDEKKYVVVIDPGHGGDNLGAEDYGPLEKDITLVTANAMYAALSQYDNVEVYMTRTSDVSLSLEERADIAKSKNADLLVSLHYNASTDHERYGSEVLVSTSAPYNGYGYQLGVIQLEQMKSLGMYIRGVKCKSGNHGDYYGLLRFAAAKGITPVIFEHCFMDQSSDHNLAISTSQQQLFGTQDAIAVAKYLGLYSTSLGVDYRGYEKANVDVNSVVGVTVDDHSAPEEISVSVVSQDAASGVVVFSVHGVDSNDPIIYYDYSLDGGVTFSSPRSQWPGANPVYGKYDSDFTFQLTLTPGVNSSIVIRAHNMFDDCSQSAPVAISW